LRLPGLENPLELVKTNEEAHMKVVIMGCGRVGEQLARLMDKEGHEVTIIDLDSRALKRLGSSFKGHKVRGIGFDRDVLMKAGIEDADAFAATSASDNANIIAARIARNIFKVPRVVARVYDPGRAEVYQRLGLRTISSTTWGAERFRELLAHSELDPEHTFGSGEVCMITLEVPSILVGRMVKHLSIPGEINVVAITRNETAFIPLMGAEFRMGDLIHVVLLASSMDRLQEMLGLLV
jgi:trk system potassium uptake protein TrkA